MSPQEPLLHSRTGLLGLPTELLSEIALLLSHRGILRLASTCRRLQETYKTSNALRYEVELGAAGLIDNSPLSCPLKLSERRALFNARRAAWRGFFPQGEQVSSSPDVWLAFDLAGGVYAQYTISRTPQLGFHWLPSRAFEEKRAGISKMDVLVKDLAMDPSQDLIVFLEGYRVPHGLPFDDEPVGTDHAGNLRLHLRSLKSHGQSPHEHASGGHILSDRCTLRFAENIEVFLVNDILAVFAGQETPFLRMWDWKLGRLLVSLDPDDFLAEKFMTCDFAFISDHAFVLTRTWREVESSDSISIHLVAFDHSPPSLGTAGRSLLRDSVQLSLPQPKSDRSVPYILAKTGSFALPEPRRQLHNVATGSRVHIFLIQALHNTSPLSHTSDVAAMVVVKTSNLVRLLDRPSDAPRELPWSSWGPGNTRIVEHGEADGLSERAVFGSRVVFSTQYTESYTTTPPWMHFVLDFNVPGLSGDDDTKNCRPDGDSLADQTRIIGREQSTFGMGLRPEKASYSWTDEDHVVDQLPCVCTRLRPTAFGIGDEVLIDDERLIRRRTFLDSDMEQTTIFRF